MKRLFPALLLAAAAASANAAGIYPEYKSLVDKHAALQGLDVNLVWAVMYAESRGNRTAISPKNARGLMQVIPPTAARMGVNPKHLYDPEQNIIAGTRYLRFLSNRFKGNFDTSLPPTMQVRARLISIAAFRRIVKPVTMLYRCATAMQA